MRLRQPRPGGTRAGGWRRRWGGRAGSAPAHSRDTGCQGRGWAVAPRCPAGAGDGCGTQHVRPSRRHSAAGTSRRDQSEQELTSCCVVSHGHHPLSARNGRCEGQAPCVFRFYALAARESSARCGWGAGRNCRWTYNGDILLSRAAAFGAPLGGGKQNVPFPGGHSSGSQACAYPQIRPAPAQPAPIGLTGRSDRSYKSDVSDVSDVSDNSDTPPPPILYHPWR